MTTLVPIQTDAFGEWWPQTEPLALQALYNARSLLTLDELYTSLKTGTRQLWLIMSDHDVVGCVITEIYPTQRGLTCAMPIAAGRDDHIGPCLEVIEAWARSEGCARMEFVGRMGWVRRMKRYGWQTMSMTIEKELI